MPAILFMVTFLDGSSAGLGSLSGLGGFGCVTRFVRRRDGFRRPFGEAAVIGQEPPDDACQATGNDHQGVRVFLALGAVLAINAREVVMTTTDHEGGKVQGATQQGGTAFADLAAPRDRVARIVQAWVQAHVGDILVGRGKVAEELQQRLAVAFEQYTNARYQAEKYSKDILPNAKASLKLTADGYQQGEFGYLSLLTAQRTYFQTNLAYLEALRELRSASAIIEGNLLSDSLRSEAISEQGSQPARELDARGP